MSGLWSRAAPSLSTCRCVSCLTTAANGLTSRTAGAASRRRLRIGNSLTMFYSSIFAGAALADARVKEQRRRELEENIATVKGEVQTLLDEERRLLEAVSLRKRSQPVSFLRLGQARSYSTASADLAETAQAESGHLSRSVSQDRVPSKDGADSAEKDDDDDDVDDQSPWGPTPAPHWVRRDPRRLKALQSLALKQLALRLLLRPTIAHDYSGIPVDFARESEFPELKTAGLLAELNKTRRRLNILRSASRVSYEDLLGNMNKLDVYQLDARKQRLDDLLQDDLESYMRAEISLSEVIVRISNNIIQPAHPDRPKAFRMMVLVFTRTRQNDIVDLLLRTLLPNFFKLTSSLIITILSYFRKAKDLKRFDEFLLLLRGESHPVNLGGLEAYERKVVNGVEITVPPLDSHNFVVYSALITATLRFDQPDRANAWLQAARSLGFLDNFSTLYAYLKFYAIRQDWENGVLALQRSLAFLTSSTALALLRVERLIVFMVHLCDECHQPVYSDLIIAAAMQSGFSWTAPRDQQDINHDDDLSLERWTRASRSVPPSTKDRPAWKKCFDFSTALNTHISDAISAAHHMPETKIQLKMSAKFSQGAFSVALAERRAAVAAAATTTTITASSLRHEPSMATLSAADHASFEERTGRDSPSQADNNDNNTVADEHREITALKLEVAELKRAMARLQGAINHTPSEPALKPSSRKSRRQIQLAQSR